MWSSHVVLLLALSAPLAGPLTIDLGAFQAAPALQVICDSHAVALGPAVLQRAGVLRVLGTVDGRILVHDHAQGRVQMLKPDGTAEPREWKVPSTDINDALRGAVRSKTIALNDHLIGLSMYSLGEMRDKIIVFDSKAMTVSAVGVPTVEHPTDGTRSPFLIGAHGTELVWNAGDRIITTKVEPWTQLREVVRLGDGSRIEAAALDSSNLVTLEVSYVKPDLRAQCEVVTRSLQDGSKVSSRIVMPTPGLFTHLAITKHGVVVVGTGNAGVLLEKSGQALPIPCLQAGALNIHLLSGDTLIATVGDAAELPSTMSLALSVQAR